MSAAAENPTISSNQARGLGERLWRVNGATYRFGPYVGGKFSSGKEAVTCPLYDERGEATAYFKVYKKQLLFPKRIERIKWLIGQRLDSWCPELLAAPAQWVDTRVVGRPDGFEHDFLCCLAGAAPGETWENVKEQVSAGDLSLSDVFRRSCVQNFLRALAALEHGGIIHGDLSPANIIVNRTAVGGAPSLYLIDLDAFVAPRAGAIGRLSVEEGGVYGTEDYCPPELRELEGEHLLSAVPYSDRHARDMLVLELLCFEQGLPTDPPWRWPREMLESRLRRNGHVKETSYLLRQDLFELPEQERLPSRELAQAFGASVPPRIKHRRRPVSTGRKMTWSGAGIETALGVMVFVLWFLCAGLWSAASFAASNWLIGSAATGFFFTGMRWFTALGLLLAGVIGLSSIAVSGREPTLVQVGPVSIVFPPRWNRERSEALHLVLVAGRLCGVFFILAAIVWLITRLGG